MSSYKKPSKINETEAVTVLPVLSLPAPYISPFTPAQEAQLTPFFNAFLAYIDNEFPLSGVTGTGSS